MIHDEDSAKNISYHINMKEKKAEVVIQQGWQGPLDITSVCKILGCIKKKYALSCVWRWTMEGGGGTSICNCQVYCKRSSIQGVAGRAVVEGREDLG